ncbi:MAG: M23 family metallopeptidase [Parcubacteria group bacterium]|jgi:murein DD-endopeptidase MepM/ murein hydrolase activator NlpD
METTNKYFIPIKLNKDILVTYHTSPAHIGRLYHSVDFIAPLETPILAALDGKVTAIKLDSDIGGSTEDFDQYGNYIEIKHANGEFSMYEHMRKNGGLVKIGDHVKTGQAIGYVGETGWMADLGPHLHFNVHKYTRGNGPTDYEALKIHWVTPPPNKENII